MKWPDLVALALELPDVEESTSYGRPALKVRGKFFAGFNTKENAFVLKLPDLEAQAFLLEAAPAIYFLTEHYKGRTYILARPAKLTKTEARGRLLQAWRLSVPKALLKKFDAR